MKALAVLVEPANYTLDLINNIYIPKNIDYVFIKNNSLASNEHKKIDYLQELSFQRRCIKIYKLLKDYEVFHINGYSEITCFTFIIINIFIFRKPFTIDSDTELIIPKNIVKKFIKWIWLHFLFSRDYCFGFAGGNYGHKELFRYYGMNNDHIFLAPMVVDNEKYKNEKKNNKSKELFKFGYFGRLIKLKQVDKILEAMKKLNKDNKTIELIIVGDGEERLKLKQYVKKNNLPVKFLGSLYGNNKIITLHSLDCLILYSYYESWGLVVNEALASGIPVIISDKVGAKRDLVEGERTTGLIAKWNDIDDLVDKMKMMMDNNEMRECMSKNALKRMDVWNYDLYSHQYDSFLEYIRNCKK